MVEDHVEHIPPELLKFFRENVGEILLVKGPPGSGKTLFSLECMRALCKNKKGITIFSRMDQDQMAVELPWLMEGGDKKRMYPFHGNTKMADPNWFKREFDALNARNEGDPIGYMLFDPIDAITEQYENPERKMKEIVSLVQSTNVSAIMVQEMEDTTYLDHLAGGVVRLYFGEKEGRRYRALSLEKLRGVEVKHSKYIFTLHKGIFRSFRPWNLKDVPRGDPIVIKDSETHFSTGLQDLDMILEGGYRRGSYNIMDVDDNVTSFEYFLLLKPVLLSFIMNGNGILMIPPAGEHPESIRLDLMDFIDKETLSKKLIFLDYFSTSSPKPYIIPMGATKKVGVQQRGQEAMQMLRGTEKRPYLDFVGLDTMEYLNGESLTLRHLLTGVSKTKVTKTLGIGIVKPGLKIGQGIRNMSDVYIRVVKINSIPCFFGIKPETGIFAIMPDLEHGYPNLKIEPLT
ncbi:MAG: gas vesicle protein GvpD P-loop domain-containing protein [Candidatus Thermoplasmatota archaeon]|nr:gas vesicle protein GvpD P-loop domain-containing protein [Candidatus Thermoplasmatota archaeon]